jgi:hypothetical protein
MKDSDDIQTVVYYDDDYLSGWISEDAGRRIAQYLQNKTIEIKKADGLREIMIKSIEKENSFRKLVVFSQDMIPDTIAEDYTSNTTLREFLDQGGSILWMGDIPAYSIGKRVKIRDELAGQSGAPVSIFGVVPIFAHTVKKGVNITYEGQILGLKHKWSGVRPILPDTGIRPLAESEVIYALPYIKSILAKDVVDQLKKPTKWGVAIEAGIPQIFKIGYRTEEKGEVDVNRQFIHEVFPNAWFKNYNRNYPVSGFYRIWDFLPRNFPMWMIEELYTVIKSIEDRLKIGIM